MGCSVAHYPSLAAQLERRLEELLATQGQLSANSKQRIADAVHLMVTAAYDPHNAGGAGSLSPAQILTIRSSKLLARELPPGVYRAQREQLRAEVRRLVAGLDLPNAVDLEV